MNRDRLQREAIHCAVLVIPILGSINGDFRRWTSAWHAYYKETDPEGYLKHQRKAGQGRQRQLRRLRGEDGYRAYQKRLAKIRWNGKGGV